MLNNETTEYFCQMFKFPTDWVTNKRSLIRVSFDILKTFSTKNLSNFF